MAEIGKLTVRSCPICRVAMVRGDIGWNCPQCGSAIIEPSKGEGERRERTAEPQMNVAAGRASRG
jgi:uncharacterized Zn finger protein (UPF0148 family)